MPYWHLKILDHERTHHLIQDQEQEIPATERNEPERYAAGWIDITKYKALTPWLELTPSPSTFRNQANHIIHHWGLVHVGTDSTGRIYSIWDHTDASTNATWRACLFRFAESIVDQMNDVLVEEVNLFLDSSFDRVAEMKNAMCQAQS
jgi:hypothetical protein